MSRFACSIGAQARPLTAREAEFCHAGTVRWHRTRNDGLVRSRQRPLFGAGAGERPYTCVVGGEFAG